MNVSRYSSPYERPDWVIAQVLWVSYFTITAYLFLALVLYLYRHRKEPQVTRRRGLFMYGFVTSAFVLALLEMGINEWGLVNMADSGDKCESWRQIHHLAFITSLVPGYIFLWIRQHAFYGDAMLKTMTNKKLMVFSWVVLGMFFLGYGFFMGFFGSPAYTRTHEYVVTNFACYSGKHKERSSLFYGIAISLLIFYQTSLLFLFTYPIWKSNQEDESISETMRVIMGYIGKCRLLTIISATTDLAAFASSVVLKRIWNAPLSILTVVYDIDLLINLFCLLLCLKPWKDIVFPLRQLGWKKRSSASRQSRNSYVNSEVRSDSVNYKPVRINSQLSDSGSVFSPTKTAITPMASLPESDPLGRVGKLDLNSLEHREC